MVKKLLLSTALVFSLLFGLIPCPVQPAFAADERIFVPIQKPSTLPGPVIKEQNVKDDRASLITIFTANILPRFAVQFTAMIAGLAFLFLIIGGVRFMVSYGNDEMIESAKKQVMYALVGLLIALLAYSVVVIISNIPLITS